MASLNRQPNLFQKKCRYVSLLALLVAGTLICFVLPSNAQHMLAPASIAENASSSNAVRPEPSTIVIGFMGGLVKRNEPNRSEVRLAAKLRGEFPDATYIDTYANIHRKAAREKILKLLDADKDGKLSADEKRRARIILFGHSWGASTTVTLARELGNLGIPVLLTVQVDSVQKIGQKDGVIPSNVAEAINFYQPDGILHGRGQIRAEDPARTKILGNQKLSYEHTSLSCKGYPLQQRIFAREHMYIECDPEVWTQIEALIRSRLPQLQAQTPTQGN